MIYESDQLCSGVIAEMPSVNNCNRYLIFFDNGVARYVRRNHVYPIFDLVNCPWERLHLDHAKFLLNYYAEYPNRNMLVIKPTQSVSIYFNGEW